MDDGIKHLYRTGTLRVRDEINANITKPPVTWRTTHGRMYQINMTQVVDEGGVEPDRVFSTPTPRVRDEFSADVSTLRDETIAANTRETARDARYRRVDEER
jgi:hypothetical protein